MIGLLALAIGAPAVVTLEDDGPAWVELRAALPGGASSDPRGKSGLAHVASLVLERRLASMGARVELGRSGIVISAGAPSPEAESASMEIIGAIAREATTISVAAGECSRRYGAWRS